MDFDLSIFGGNCLRLLIAGIAGGVVGFEREHSGHWAGLRTHMIVSLGAAVFVMLGEIIADGDPNAAARVVQGVAAGIGFLGVGTILKLDDREQIRGLTTASSIWLAAAVGAVAGFGRYELTVATTIFAIAILALLRPVGDKIGNSHKNHNNEQLHDDSH